MNRDVTFGQFIPGNSILHRMDPRVKIVLLCTIIATIFCTFNFYALGLITAFIIVAILLSGVPFKMYLKSLKVIMIIVIITSLLNIFYSSGTPIFEFWIFKITLDGIFRAIYVTVRIIALILISSALTFTTSPTDLTDAIERLMSPLKVFHIKVHEIAMMMTIALRFIPTLLDETDKIMSAQKARGADMESGNVFQKVKALIPVLIPLFVSAFRRAYELAVAMECRCYQGGEGRTRMKSLHMHRLDYISIILMVFVVSGVVLCDIFLMPI
ncbi:MAG: energy-coupling factor transporter transmembrane component T [Oscillospiraceae bacterium]|nr:energy-coupling factor transporter transmembrane component T [Oscillospiraceae bacterium]